jgi:hypothetical protein
LFLCDWVLKAGFPRMFWKDGGRAEKNSTEPYHRLIADCAVSTRALGSFDRRRGCPRRLEMEEMKEIRSSACEIVRFGHTFLRACEG